jgi:5-methylcytosine-specific restriction protein A
MSWANRTNAPRRLRGEQAQKRRAAVLRRNPHCVLCGMRPSTQADHIVPLAEGGADHESNMQGVCMVCHKAKTQVEAAQGVLRNAKPQPRSATRW